MLPDEQPPRASRVGDGRRHRSQPPQVPQTIERRRFLQLAERGREQWANREQFTPYVDAGISMVRAFTFDGGVQGRASTTVSARSRSRSGKWTRSWSHRSPPSRTPSTSPETSQAASKAALRALAHPDAERRPTAHAVARLTPALVDVDRGLVDVARVHSEKAKTLIGAIHSRPKLARRHRLRDKRFCSCCGGQARRGGARVGVRGALLSR